MRPRSWSPPARTRPPRAATLGSESPQTAARAAPRPLSHAGRAPRNLARRGPRIHFPGRPGRRPPRGPCRLPAPWDTWTGRARDHRLPRRRAVALVTAPQRGLSLTPAGETRAGVTPGQAPQHSEPQCPRLTMSPASAVGEHGGRVPKTDGHVNDSARNPVSGERLRDDLAWGSGVPRLALSPVKRVRWGGDGTLRPVMAPHGVQVDGQEVGVRNPTTVLCWGRGWGPPREASRALPGSMAKGTAVRPHRPRAPTPRTLGPGSSTWTVRSPEQRAAPGQPCRWFWGPQPRIALQRAAPRGLPAWPGGGRRLTRPTLSALLSSSGMGTYTASATQLAKMVSRMMVSKGLRPALRREARGGRGPGRGCWGSETLSAGASGPHAGASRPRSPGSRLGFPL